MIHHANPSFWACYKKLPEYIRNLSDKNFELLKNDPRHPSLHFKQTGKYRSVRIGRKYRAVAVEQNEELIWFWIGSHAEYDRLIDV
jgi:hypothetical protein